MMGFLVSVLKSTPKHTITQIKAAHLTIGSSALGLSGRLQTYPHVWQEARLVRICKFVSAQNYKQQHMISLSLHIHVSKSATNTYL